MIVIPAIDLKDGRCVRLRQGDMAAETVYSEDIPTVARRWQEQGAEVIHVVDLNGAVDGEPRNLPQIEQVMRHVDVRVQVGGGIRNIQTVRRYLKAGVSRVVLGTAALTDRAFLEQACKEFPGASFSVSMRETGKWPSKDGRPFPIAWPLTCSKRCRAAKSAP